MNIPYIGITDFMQFDQVGRMLSVFNQNLKPNQKRRLHVGVMMSQKTLNNIDTKWTNAFPAKEKIAEIFSSGETMNCLHYADYDDIDVARNLIQAIHYGGPGINALQLDMVWPDPKQVLNAIKYSEKKLEVILQVGKNAIEQAGDNPYEIVKRLYDYTDLITHVLIDKSMGRGLGLDANEASSYIYTIKEAFPEIGIVVAGGLGPKTINLIEPLLKNYGDISIDAQGKLRPSGSALDPIDWDMAGNYLKKALQLLD